MTDAVNPATHFASPERASAEQIKEQSARLRRDAAFINTLSTVPQGAVVLNEQRQVLFANRVLLDAFCVETEEEALGLRPGEAFHCAHAVTAPSGCGTAVSCRYCGAMTALNEAFAGKVATHAVSLTTEQTHRHQSAEFELTVVPLSHEGQRVFLCFVRDTSDRLRRESYERVFYHDILNLAGLVSSYAAYILDNSIGEAETGEILRRISAISEALVEEINHQRVITAADVHQLHVNPVSTDVGAVLAKTAGFFCSQSQYKGKEIKLNCKTDKHIIVTDPLILRRVVSNMIKNALEASVPGDVITLDCRRDGIFTVVSVHNPLVMPEEIRTAFSRGRFPPKAKGAGWALTA